jgi:peptidoglycan/LPS O-acetylase OafA/YrhL
MPEGLRQSVKMNRRLVHLDMIHRLAALAICASHARAFLLVDFGEVKVKAAAVSFVYAIADHGHQSVMSFFVLSVFFIGGSVAERRRSGDCALLCKGYLVVL